MEIDTHESAAAPAARSRDADVRPRSQHRSSSSRSACRSICRSSSSRSSSGPVGCALAMAPAPRAPSVDSVDSVDAADAAGADTAPARPSPAALKAAAAAAVVVAPALEGGEGVCGGGGVGGVGEAGGEGAGVPAVFREEGAARYTLLPIRHARLWQLYKQHQASFWTAEELDLAADVRDWVRLSPAERGFLSHVLAFFAASDGIVLENLLTRFCCDVQLPEARCFYAFQAAMENVHSEAYALLIETLVAEPAERTRLFRAIETIPCVREKADWARRWCGSGAGFVSRLLAFACVEGIFFSGSFCAVFWMKKRGLMPGLTFSNELIARDEGLHCDFACALYDMLPAGERLSERDVHTIVASAVESEKRFICEALSVDLIGMNAAAMAAYIEFVADRLAVTLGYQKLYRTENPFEFMNLIGTEGKTNFFERRVGEYQKAGVTSDRADNTFRLDADF